MAGFLSGLLSSTDRSVDEVIVGGFLCQLTFQVLEIYDVMIAHHDFTPVSYAGAAATLLAATAGAVAGRDRISPNPPRPPQAGG